MFSHKSQGSCRPPNAPATAGRPSHKAPRQLQSSQGPRQSPRSPAAASKASSRPFRPAKGAQAARGAAKPMPHPGLSFKAC
eukprot:3792330-Lingulodinium_polyedra.AAC.1